MTDRTDGDAALGQSRWALALASVLLIAVIGVIARMTYVLEEGMLIREDRIMAQARELLSEHSDEVFAEAGALAAEVLPPVTTAAAAVVEEDISAYLHAVDEQGEQLTDNLSESLRRKGRAHYRKFLATHRAALQEEFPELSDEEALKRLEASFERAYDRLLDRYLVDEFKAVASRLAKSWSAIPPAPSEPGQPSLGERLLTDLGDWAELEFAAQRDKPADRNKSNEGS